MENRIRTFDADFEDMAQKEPKSLEEQKTETEKRGITEVLLKPKQLELNKIVNE